MSIYAGELDYPTAENVADAVRDIRSDVNAIVTRCCAEHSFFIFDVGLLGAMPPLEVN